MRHTIFPALSLATLLLACAHDPANHHAGTAANAQRRAEARSESASANQGVGRVEVPQRGVHHDRIASNDRTIPAAGSGPSRGQDTAHVPDNTGVNERDRNSANVTPMDQGNGEIDLDLTQRIRKAVMADDSLSFAAKNAKIITRDGQVTLRGPVNNAAEKSAIYKCAVSAAGVSHVNNELEVTAK